MIRAQRTAAALELAASEPRLRIWRQLYTFVSRLSAAEQEVRGDDRNRKKRHGGLRLSDRGLDVIAHRLEGGGEPGQRAVFADRLGNEKRNRHFISLADRVRRGRVESASARRRPPRPRSILPPDCHVARIRCAS